MAPRFAFAGGLVMSLIIANGGCNSTSAGDEVADASPDAATVVADARSDAPIACANGYDCASLFVTEPPSGSSVPCCVDSICQLEPYDGCIDASAQHIQASDYDQTCNVDNDCVGVAEGDFCSPGAGNCPNATINKGAMAQYQADVAKTRAYSCYAPGSCGSGNGPCCVAGKCQIFGQCVGLAVDAASDTGVRDAAADTGIDAATDGAVPDTGAEERARNRDDGMPGATRPLPRGVVAPG